jgi:hypothetical protein
MFSLSPAREVDCERNSRDYEEYTLSRNLTELIKEIELPVPPEVLQACR